MVGAVSYDFDSFDAKTPVNAVGMETILLVRSANMHVDIFNIITKLSSALNNHVCGIIQRTLWTAGLTARDRKDNGVFVLKSRSQNYEKYYYSEACC